MYVSEMFIEIDPFLFKTIPFFKFHLLQSVFRWDNARYESSAERRMESDDMNVNI